MVFFRFESAIAALKDPSVSPESIGNERLREAVAKFKPFLLANKAPPEKYFLFLTESRRPSRESFKESKLLQPKTPR